MLALFVTSNPSAYYVKVFSPLDSSDHNLILYSVLLLLCNLWTHQSGGAAGIMPLLSERTWGYLFWFIVELFHVRDASVCSQGITVETVTDMEAYTPHTLFSSEARKPWFTCTCCRAIGGKETCSTHTSKLGSVKGYQPHQFPFFSCLQSPIVRRSIASFGVFYWCFPGYFFSELGECVLPFLPPAAALHMTLHVPTLIPISPSLFHLHW